MIARDCADGGDQSERINTPTEEVPDLLADSADEEEAPQKQRVKSTSLHRRGRPGTRGSWNAGKESARVLRQVDKTPTLPSSCRKPAGQT